MASLTPRAYHLTGVNYLARKRQVIVEFTNGEDKLTKSFRFYPSLISPQCFGSQNLVESILSLFDKRRFMVQEGKGAVTVTASTFHDLEKIASPLESSLEQPILLLAPERQFLIGNGWSFFDRFLFNKNDFYKANTVPGILPLQFMDTVEELMSLDGSAASEFTDRLALSNILTEKPVNIPESDLERAEFFLEKIFFRHKFPLPNKPAKESQSITASMQRRHGVAKLDFSNIWSSMLSPNSFNLGFETGNCSCCKPVFPGEPNVAPNSLVNARFLVDGAYFESNSKEWAGEFHSKMPLQKQRLKHKREWFLQSIPIGPFYKNQAIQLPLVDALQLLSEGKIVLENNGHLLSWFCTKKKSFLSREILAIKNRIGHLERIIRCEEQNSMKKHKILYHECLGANHFYRAAFKHRLTELFNCLPTILLNKNSRFYSPMVAGPIACLQSSIVKKFREFSREHGQKAIESGNYNLFVRMDSALSLARGFSDKFSLPPPEICSAGESFQ